MQMLRLPSLLARHRQDHAPGSRTADTDIDIDLCFSCHGIWFDDQENLQLAPQGVIDLFRTLHAHTDTPHTPLASHMHCPRCPQPLLRIKDRTVHGSYTLYRCAAGHGRFLSFSSFMLKRGFARQLRPPEITQLAQTVRTIHCGSCGAAVDLRNDHICPYCRSAFSLLDPQAVTQALAHYQQQAVQHSTVDRSAIVQAIADSHQRQLEHERKEQQSKMPLLGGRDQLWSAGLELVLRGLLHWMK